MIFTFFFRYKEKKRYKGIYSTEKYTIILKNITLTMLPCKYIYIILHLLTPSSLFGLKFSFVMILTGEGGIMPSGFTVECAAYHKSTSLVTNLKNCLYDPSP